MRMEEGARSSHAGFIYAVALQQRTAGKVRWRQAHCSRSQEVAPLFCGVQTFKALKTVGENISSGFVRFGLVGLGAARFGFGWISIRFGLVRFGSASRTTDV